MKCGRAGLGANESGNFENAAKTQQILKNQAKLLVKNLT